MYPFLVFLFLMVSVCVAIHGAGAVFFMRWLNRLHETKTLIGPFGAFWIIVRFVYGLLVLHLLQIVAWAFAYWIGEGFPDFTTAFYYSATSYSTVGYGDVLPAGNWKIIGAVEAVTGVLMFGWSTGMLFSVVNQLTRRFHEVRSSSLKTDS